jgi:hypothetical protein
MPEATEAAAAESAAASSEPTQETFHDEAADIFNAEVAKPAVKADDGKEVKVPVKSDDEVVLTDEEKAAKDAATAAAKASKDAKAEDTTKAKEQPKDIFPEIEKLHPGARQKASTPEFQAWLNGLPQNLQDMVDSGDAKQSAAILDMYDVMQASKPKAEPMAAKIEAPPAEFKPFTFDQVKDLKFKNAAGEEQSLADFRGQYDEIADAVLALFNHLMPQALKGVKSGPSGDFVAKTDLQTFQNQIAGELFESRVERGAPGAGEKIQTPEFKAFIDKATPLQKRMFSEGSAKDVIEVVKEFDRVQGVEKTKAAAQKQREKKQGLDATHSNGLRGAASMEKPAASGEHERDPAQDEKDAQDEFDKQANALAAAKRR